MFWKMVGKEVKYQFKSMTFYAFLFVVILFYIIQFQPPNKYDPLKPVESNIGEKLGGFISIGQKEIMDSIYYRMKYDADNGVTLKYNSFSKKWSKLNQEEIDLIKETRDKIFKGLDKEGNPIAIKSYNEIEKLAKDLDSKLGGNTIYNISDLDENKSIDDLIIHYDYKAITDPNEKITVVYDYLNNILSWGQYPKTGLILNKFEELDGEKRQSIRKTMEKISPKGLDKDGNLKTNITYSEFQDILDNLDKALGGNTELAEDERRSLYVKRISYGDERRRFNGILEEKLTNAYGRYLADYMGITAGFYLVFISAFILHGRRRKEIYSLINSRGISAKKIILSKYIGVSISVLLCYLLIASHATFVFYNIANNYNYPIDLFAFYKYILIWVMPTALFTIAMGIFLSSFFKRPLFIIIIQGILYTTSVLPLIGDYGLTRFIIRFNRVGYHHKYIQWYGDIIMNRAFYFIVSIGLVMMAIYIFERRKVDNIKAIKN